jgi:hypothetical protein
MIKMLGENPKLKFENWKGTQRTVVKIGVYGFIVANVTVDSERKEESLPAYNFFGNFTPKSEWALVREPVPVWEAIKAWVEGKEIHCHCNDVPECKNNPCLFPQDDRDDVSMKCFKEGRFYIED